MMQEMLFSMVIFIKQIQPNLILLTEVNIEMDVIWNIKKLNIEVIIVINGFHLMVIVLSYVIFI